MFNFSQFIKSLRRKPRPQGRYAGRWRVRDVAITFRMQAGFLGDVTRTHPAGVEPALVSVTNPPTAYGQAMIVDGSDPNRGLRPLQSGDNALTAVYGILVRPFPTQIPTATLAFGQANFDSVTSSTPPQSGAIDVLRQGYVMVQLDAAGKASPPVKNTAAFIWVAANSGNHVQNQFETSATGGSTVALSGAGSVGAFNGGPDSNGIVELMFNI